MPDDSRKPWEHAKGGGSEADPLAARFVSSLDYDRRLYRHDIAGSVAHARMLQQVGLIDADDLRFIEDGLEAIGTEIDQLGDDWPGWRVELEDVHMCIEAALIEKIGDAGRKLHTGRSRNDQVALDLKLWIDEAAGQLSARFRALQQAFIGLAEKDGRIVMPSYTHLQRAQPIVAGGELMAWVAMLDRARRRLEGLEAEGLQNPLGSGAIAGSGLPLDREAAAFALPLGVPSDNSIYATSARDAGIDFVYALSMTSLALSRWAEQWTIYATTEFGFITLSDLYTTGSSMMPQKQNPDMLELIRGKTGQAYGSLIALLTMCKGLTIGYNRDLQEDKRHVFTAFDAVCDCLDMAERIVSTTRFNEQRIAERLDRGYLDATSLSDYLVTKGLPFRSAHQVVGALVRLSEEQGLAGLGQLGLERMNEVVAGAMPEDRPLPMPVVEEDVYDWLGAANVVKRYRTAGNAGLTGFEQQIELWKQRLADV